MSRSVLRYDDASRPMILRFKHGDALHAVPCFVPWLVRVGAGVLDDADMIVPVPLHRGRLWKRRYNQAAVLALALGRATGVAALPDALIRTRATPPQGHKGAKDRHRNVQGAFTANPKHGALLRGKHIVLIDDVVTTGATVNACAGALKAAKAARVSVLALARVVREGQD
jgi:ComF family protein